MKKINLIELVQDALSSDSDSDTNSQFHPETIRRFLELAFNEIVLQAYFNGRKYSDYSQLDVWTKDYPILLTEGNLDPVTGLVTGNLRLPFPPVQLPNNMGIRQIVSTEDTTIFFAYMENTASPIFNALEVSTVDSTPIFTVGQNDSGSGIASHILKLSKIPESLYTIPEATSFTVKLIVPLEQIDDFTDIVLPDGGERNLVLTTIELMKGKQPADTLNDQLTNKPNQ
jgi:hypothetical protein